MALRTVALLTMRYILCQAMWADAVRYVQWLYSRWLYSLWHSTCIARCYALRTMALLTMALLTMALQAMWVEVLRCIHTSYPLHIHCIYTLHTHCITHCRPCGLKSCAAAATDVSPWAVRRAPPTSTMTCASPRCAEGYVVIVRSGRTIVRSATRTRTRIRTRRPNPKP